MIFRTAVTPAVVALLLGGSGCTLTIGDVAGKGVGELCQTTSDCHNGSCEAGLCTMACTADDDCPAPTACFATECAYPLRVSALLEGAVGVEGWNFTHHQGMVEAAKALPYLTWNFEENIAEAPAGTISAAVDRSISSGAQVIVANSFDQQAALVKKAKQYPQVKFIVGGGSIGDGKNLGSFYSYYEQAWYTAGKLAAMKAKKRIGMIAALVSSDQVRNTNAFLLGARSVKPEIVVEVAWIGFWFDYNTLPQYDYGDQMLYREELLAARMIASGCEVIGHDSDNERSIRYIDDQVRAGRAHDVWSIADNSRDADRTVTASGPNGPPLQSCLGTAFLDFGGQYAKYLDQVHRGSWKANAYTDSMTSSDTTPVGFDLNPTVGLDQDVAASFGANTVALGHLGIFRGPYQITGQRDRNDDGIPDPVQSMASGEAPSEDEYYRMCWFVRGVVQKSDPLDPTSADVDAQVPDGDVAPPPDILPPLGSAPGTQLRCHENL